MTPKVQVGAGKKGFSKGGFALLKILTNYLHYLHQEHSFSNGVYG